MVLAEAREYIGRLCNICYKDRSGNEHTIVSKIYDATYVPLYGGYIVTDTDDIRLDRLCTVTLAEGGNPCRRRPGCDSRPYRGVIPCKQNSGFKTGKSSGGSSAAYPGSSHGRTPGIRDLSAS